MAFQKIVAGDIVKIPKGIEVSQGFNQFKTKRSVWARIKYVGKPTVLAL